MPYITISEKNAVDFMTELIAAKNLYNLVEREHLEERLDDGPKYDMFYVSHIAGLGPDGAQSSIAGFNKEYLYTLVLFDDISNSKLFSLEESYFSQQLRRCRHTNITYFLLIQGWKGIKPHIKNEITTLFVFPCFNRQQLHYIYSQ